MSKVRRLLPKKQVITESINIKNETKIIKKNNDYIRGIEDTRSKHTTDDKFEKLLNDTKTKKQTQNNQVKKKIVKKTLNSSVAKGVGATGATIGIAGTTLHESETQETPEVGTQIAPWENYEPLTEANLFSTLTKGLNGVKKLTQNTKFEGPFNQHKIQPKIDQFAKEERLKAIAREKALINKKLYQNTIKRDTLDGGESLRNEYRKIVSDINKRKGTRPTQPTQPAKQILEDKKTVEKTENNNVKGNQYNPYHNYI